MMMTLFAAMTSRRHLLLRAGMLIKAVGLFGMLLLQLPILEVGALYIGLMTATASALFLSHTTDATGRLWTQLKHFQTPTGHGEQYFTLIDELEGLGRFVRSNGMVALGKDLPMWSFSHPYLQTALNYCLDAKSEDALYQLLRLQGSANEVRLQHIIDRFKAGTRALLPVASMVNAFGVLLALKGLLPAEWAMGSFLFTAGAYLIQALAWLPFGRHLEQRLAEEKILHRMVQHGVRALWRQEHPTAIRQDLEAYLPRMQESTLV